MTNVTTTNRDAAAAPTMAAREALTAWLAAREAVDRALIEALEARTRWANELATSQDATIAAVKPPRRPVGIHQA